MTAYFQKSITRVSFSCVPLSIECEDGEPFKGAREEYKEEGRLLTLTRHCEGVMQ